LSQEEIPLPEVKHPWSTETDPIIALHLRPWTHPVRVSGMRLSHCTLPGEPWHCPSSPWRAGRAAGVVRTAKMVSGPAFEEGTYLLSPALAPHCSSWCADLPCSNPEPGWTPDSSIHKTLPRPPSFFDCLITWPSHPSRPNQRNYYYPAQTATPHTKKQLASSQDSFDHLPIASASQLQHHRYRPPNRVNRQRAYLTAQQQQPP
jgi:hypothetical protein